MSILSHNIDVAKRSQSPIPRRFWNSSRRNRNCGPADPDQGVSEVGEGDWSGNEDPGCGYLEGYEYWQGDSSGLGWFAFE